MHSGGEKANEPEDTPPRLPPKPKSNCLGCRSYLFESEKLDLENIFVEFKNFISIPLKENKHKLIVLKTITAFLNTKGGGIYMGVEDDKCSVIGNLVSKAKQQEFKAFVSDLCRLIYPPVGEEVKTFFIPVVKRNGAFTGRYITKVLIAQGRTDTFYTFAEKVRLLTQKADGEDFELRMGFIRIGPGGVEKLEGLKMYEEVYQRSKQPNEVSRVHEGCNPVPLDVNIDAKTIGFKAQRDRMVEVSRFVIKLIHETGKIEYSERYDEARRMLVVELDNPAITEIITDNITSQVFSSSYRLKLEGIESDMYVFTLEPNNNPNQRDGGFSHERQRETPKKERKESRESNDDRDKDRGCFYVFTHVNSKTKDEFMNFLENKLPRKLRFTKYTNSILVKASSQADIDQLKSAVSKIERELHNYGHSGKIVFGHPSGHIHVYNYFQKSREKLRELIMHKYLKDRVLRTSFKTDNNDNKRSYLDIELEEKHAVEALDLLLQADDLREYKLYTKEKGGVQHVPKMKFMLQCD